MSQDSILLHIPDDEFDFFNLFRMEGTLHAQLGKDIFKHEVTLLKWYDILGFIVHNKDPNLDIHIVAQEYYDDKIRFKLWRTNDVIKVGGIVDNNGNYLELFREYEYGNPLPLRKTDPEYAKLGMNEVIHTLPLVDMFNMFKNVKMGAKVAQGMINNTPTKIFNIKIRDTIKSPKSAISANISDRVNYYLYYDDGMRLNAIERRNDKGASLLFKINRRSTYLLDKDIVILRKIEIERNY